MKQVRERQTLYGITYMWNLKNMIQTHTHKSYDTNELTYKTKTDSQTLKTNLWLSKEKDVGGRIN